MQPYTGRVNHPDPVSSEEELTGRTSLSYFNEQAPPQADAAELERLLAQWRQEQDRRNRGLWQMALVMLIVGTCVFVSNIMNWSPPVTAALVGVGLITLTPFGIAGGVYNSNAAADLFAHLQRALQEIEDVRAIVPLLDVMDAHSISDPLPIELPVAAALARLLSHLDEEATERYLRPNSDKLYACLQWGKAADYPRLVIAVLRLLPTLNDRQALVCAAGFVVQDSPTRNAQRVRDEAGTALTFLLANVDLGGPITLSGWIDRLSFGDVTLEWEDMLAPLAVLQLLPQIAPADYLALDYRSRRRLYASLIGMNLRRLQTDYTLFVLDLVRRVGDVDAVTVVRQLQRAGPSRVRTAARLCLSILEARQEREQVGKTLLRGSRLTPESGETLLRSAVSGTPDDPQLLLRAGPGANDV
jgi:hypothetical protein